MNATVSPRALKLVDRVVLHGGPIPWTLLAQHVVTPDTRYLVFDLDHTVHLGWNMGELLGWELLARRAFGDEGLADMEAKRSPGRLWFETSRPLPSLYYLWLGAKVWAGPGLYYLFFGKIPEKYDRLSRWNHRLWGPHPMRHVQQVPQHRLLDCMKDVPAETLRTLAERVWDRHAPDQIVEKKDLDTLRARCKNLRIVVSSASPQAVVDVAKARLGADEAHGSTSDHINSGPQKIVRLAQAFPDALNGTTETVGVTDTAYGEDHVWADHFTRVVDVNSPSPFSPLISRSAPLREIHSALVMTRRERRAFAASSPDWMDDRRKATEWAPLRTFDRIEMTRVLADLLDQPAPEGPAGLVAWQLNRLERRARKRLDAIVRTQVPASPPAARLRPVT